MVEWPDGSHSLSKRHMTAHLEFAKRHLKDCQTMRNKILWSVETKIELWPEWQASCLEEEPGQCHPYSEAWWCSIMLWGCFSAAGTGRLVRIEGKMNAACTETFLMKTCYTELWTSDWGEGSSSNRTTTLSTQPR